MSTIKNFIGVDPTTAFNPFAHAGAAGGEPEPRAIGRLTIELDPRHTPMTATISDEDGQTIAQLQGLTALLAYLGRWNPGTRLLDLTRADGTIATHKELFDTYHDLCRSRHKSLNNDLYRSYEAAGMQDKVKELDEAFLKQHKADEARFIQEAADIDKQLFHGQLAQVVGEYLSGLNDGRRQLVALSKDDSWLKGYRARLNVGVQRGWLIKREDGGYTKGDITDNGLAAIIGQVFYHDKYNPRSHEVSLGRKDPGIPIKQIQHLFGIKGLSQKRAKLTKETYCKFCIS